MRKKNRIVYSAIITIVIFTILTASFFLGFIPPVSDFITGLYASIPIPLFFLIYLAAIIFLFFILYLLMGIKKDYSEEIVESIRTSQFDVMNEYLENIDILSWEQITVQLEQRKDFLVDELKAKYSRKTSRYAYLIDSSVGKSWDEILNVLRVQKNSLAETERVEEPEENVGDLDEVINKSLAEEKLEEDAYLSDSSAESEEILEELEEPEVIDPLEVIGELEEIDEFDELEELEQILEFNVIEQLQNADDNLEELDYLEEPEEMEELEVVEYKDPYPELIFSLKNKPIYIADSNLTFISSLNDDFASVDNVFAEDLSIGSEYIQNVKVLSERFKSEGFKFMPVKLEFIADKKNLEEPLPADERTCFSLTHFSEKQPDFVELEEDSPQAIIEVGGVYSIAENLSYENVPQDLSFQALVNSVIR